MLEKKSVIHNNLIYLEGRLLYVSKILQNGAVKNWSSIIFS